MKYKASVGKEIVSVIKENQDLWEPMDPSENPLSKKDPSELAGLLGLQSRSPSLSFNSFYKSSANNATVLPKNYDVRKIYKQC